MEKSFNTHLPSIVCPACGKAQIPLSGIAQDVICPQCSSSFPAKNGYIDLLVKRPEDVPSIDAAMEWKWLVDIYESPMWRRSPLFGMLTGISFSHEQRKIFESLALRGNETILDVACGSGIYTRSFAQKVPQGNVIGFDLSEPMLNYAFNKVEQQNLGNVLFLRGDAMNLPFIENSFDVVNCCGALHLFPDVEKVINTVYRILKPGGRFTAVAARRPANKSTQKFVSLLRKKSGLICYADKQMLTLLQDSGFTKKDFLHHKYFWIIACAEK